MSNKKNETLRIENSKHLQLIKSIVDSEERQRETISKNLHDEINAALNVLKMNFNEINQRKQATSNADINAINKDLDAIIDDLRELCRDLIPNDLKLFGLNKALANFCERASLQTKINIQYHSSYNGELHSEKDQLIFFRLFKELLNNIIKHTNAKAIKCVIKKQQTYLDLCFSYNGAGISNTEIDQIKKTNNGIGLSSIESRLVVLNGKLDYLPDTSQINNQIKIILHGISN